MYKYSTGTRAAGPGRGANNKIKLSVDTPQPDTKIAGYLDIAGWAISENGEVEKVEAYLNSTFLAGIGHNLERPDVAAVYPFEGAARSGFAGKLSVMNLPPGNYNLTILVKDSKGVEEKV